jgi:chromosome segregation ATPase
MAEERKAEEIKKGIEKSTSEVNTTDDAINSLMNISVMLDKRIDMAKDDIKSLELKVNKITKRLEI